MQRHIDYLLSLGFDVATFEIVNQVLLKTLPISTEFKFGLKHVWADQVERMLSELPGQKIVFSLSNPSAGAIEAIGRRQGGDVKALICDGGPNAYHFKPLMNLYHQRDPGISFPMKIIKVAMGYVLLSPVWATQLKYDLSRFPKNFPILSIRGWKDPLISPHNIDQVFEPHSQLNWQKLSLPDGEHLDGLKNFADDYKPVVERFLQKVATPA
ncbi:MAG: hypothetical protein AB7O96_04090 [Pseudobdellovibrionaceae bacterium]